MRYGTHRHQIALALLDYCLYKKNMLSTSIQNHELSQFLKDYEELANKCNFDALTPFIDNDALYWFSDGSHKGINEIRTAFESTWNHIKNEKYTLDKVEWLVLTENEAVCTYNFHSDGLINGQRFTYSGRGTNVFKKKNGTWKIVHEHLSKEPQA
jgi:ketosteroid isomerase-like protein